LTPEKALCPSSLHPGSVFSATRLLSGIKFYAGKKVFCHYPSAGKRVFRNAPSVGN